MSTQTQAHGCFHARYICGKILENRRNIEVHKGVKEAWRSVNHGSGLASWARIGGLSARILPDSPLHSNLCPQLGQLKI